MTPYHDWPYNRRRHPRHISHHKHHIGFNIHHINTHLMAVENVLILVLGGWMRFRSKGMWIYYVSEETFENLHEIHDLWSKKLHADTHTHKLSQIVNRMNFPLGRKMIKFQISRGKKRSTRHEQIDDRKQKKSPSVQLRCVISMDEKSHSLLHWFKHPCG